MKRVAAGLLLVVLGLGFSMPVTVRADANSAGRAAAQKHNRKQSRKDAKRLMKQQKKQQRKNRKAHARKR